MGLKAHRAVAAAVLLAAAGPLPAALAQTSPVVAECLVGTTPPGSPPGSGLLVFKVVNATTDALTCSLSCDYRAGIGGPVVQSNCNAAVKGNQTGFCYKLVSKTPSQPRPSQTLECWTF